MGEAESPEKFLNSSELMLNMTKFESQNSGFTLKEAHFEVLSSALARCFEEIAELHKKNTYEMPAAAMLCERFLTKWLPSDNMQRAEAKLWTEVFRLGKLLREYDEKGDNPKDRMDNDLDAKQPWPMLTKIKLSAQSLQTFANAEKDSAIGKAYLKVAGTVAAAKETIAAFEVATGEVHQQALLATTGELQPIAKGGENNQSWLLNLGNNPTADQMQAHFLATLGKVDMPNMKTKMLAMRTAILVHHTPSRTKSRP